MPTATPRELVRRPERFVTLLITGWLAIGLVTAFLLPVALPGISTFMVRALGQIALTFVAVGIAGVLGWRMVEPNAGRVRQARLLILPTLIAALPLAAGVRIEHWGDAVLLIVMELVVGLSEELVFRGLILRALLPGGMLRAVLISSVLFGIAHLANVVYGAPVAVTLAQAVGTCAFGIGMAAITLRCGALWPVMLIHALSNAALRFSWFVPNPVPVPLMSAVVMTLLLGYGLFLLRGMPTHNAMSPACVEHFAR